MNMEALSKWIGHIPGDVLQDMAHIAPMLARLGYDPYANPPNYGHPDPLVVNNTHRVGVTAIPRAGGGSGQSQKGAAEKQKLSSFWEMVFSSVVMTSKQSGLSLLWLGLILLPVILWQRSFLLLWQILTCPSLPDQPHS